MNYLFIVSFLKIIQASSFSSCCVLLVVFLFAVLLEGAQDPAERELAAQGSENEFPRAITGTFMEANTPFERLLFDRSLGAAHVMAMKMLNSSYLTALKDNPFDPGGKTRQKRSITDRQPKIRIPKDATFIFDRHVVIRNERARCVGGRTAEQLRSAGPPTNETNHPTAETNHSTAYPSHLAVSTCRPVEVADGCLSRVDQNERNLRPILQPRIDIKNWGNYPVFPLPLSKIHGASGFK